MTFIVRHVNIVLHCEYVSHSHNNKVVIDINQFCRCNEQKQDIVVLLYQQQIIFLLNLCRDPDDAVDNIGN